MEKYKPGDRVLIPAEIYAVHEYKGGLIEYVIDPMNGEPYEDCNLYLYSGKNIVGKWESKDKEEA